MGTRGGITWSVIEWSAVEAIATSLAAVLSAVAVILALVDLRNRRKVDRTAQASLVTAWSTVELPPVDAMPDESAGTEELAAFYGDVKVHVHVANRSDRPVTDIWVTTDPVPSLGEDLQPGNTSIKSLGPGQERTEPLGTTDHHDALGYPGRVLTTRFTDSAGITWLRDQRTLRKVKRQR